MLSGEMFEAIELITGGKPSFGAPVPVDIDDLPATVDANMTPEEVSVQREVKTKDGAGGWKITQATVISGIFGIRRFRRKTDYNRMEEGAHGTAGPGIETQQLMVYTFERPFPYTTPFPAILVNDHIISPNGARWLVLNVRPYEATLQIDVEVVA